MTAPTPARAPCPASAIFFIISFPPLRLRLATYLGSCNDTGRRIATSSNPVAKDAGREGEKLHCR